MKEVLMFGLWFKVGKPIRWSEVYNRRFQDIMVAYGKPSEAKIYAYYALRNWALDNDSDLFGVIAKNVSMFTFGAVLHDAQTDTLYFIRITPWSRYIYEII